MSKRYQAAILTASYNGLQVPNAPTIGTATSGGLSASVTFTAPSNIGGGAITSYTAISSPGGLTGSSASSPVTVSGLTSGVSYTFTVVANNVYGSGPASAASNSITAVDPSAFIENLFSTYLYTGNGSTQTITNGIDITGEGALVWLKRRTGGTGYHILTDTARGAGLNLSTNDTIAQYNDGQPTFNSNGFNLINNNPDYNASASTYASWTFREQAKFFDIVTYTGTGTTMTVPHNLGSVPGCMIVKGLNSASAWDVYHQSLGPTQILRLSTTDAASTQPQWDNTAPTSTVFTVKGGETTNVSGRTYVAYLFAHDAGGFGTSGTDNVISCGSFTTDGSGNATVSLGYEPQWLLVKANASGNDWYMYDNMRGLSYSNYVYLSPNLSAAEGNIAADYLVPTATGFQTKSFASSTTYIYIAIRRGPMKVPTSGTSVFSPNASSAANGTTLTTNFPVDLSITQERPAGDGAYWMDRLRGANSPGVTGTSPYLRSSVTNGETSTTITSGWDNTSIKIAYFGGISCIWWNFRRAPSFFDEVCYTGNGTNLSITHNLQAVPELIILKYRAGTSYGWKVTATGLTNPNTYYLDLNGTNAESNYTANFIYNRTSTTFTVVSDLAQSGWNWVAYLFATCAGVSKVGSYTGTGALQTVNCGFAAGARFVLIKRIDSTGDWYTYDSARGITSSNDPYLFLNSTAAEVTNTDYVDTYTAGFEISSTAPAAINASGGTYIYLAIA